MKKRTGIFLLAASLLTLAGCGEDPQMADYQDRMNAFYEDFSAGAQALEGIDPSSGTAVEELLESLELLNGLTEQLAQIPVPDVYAQAGVNELAAEAADHMAQADRMYREVYGAPDSGFDQETADAAHEHYLRAMKRINYIAVMLQGRTPEAEDVTLVPQEEEPDWTGGDLPGE
ncbi:MAG: hypothetical protein Q4C65_03330 [Eubacteriales bacterium]|nr:hypothetical protein [Eubacteriales bacterium]